MGSEPKVRVVAGGPRSDVIVAIRLTWEEVLKTVKHGGELPEEVADALVVALLAGPDYGK